MRQAMLYCLVQSWAADLRQNRLDTPVQVPVPAPAPKGLTRNAARSAYR
jgi:hypothetical protein